MHGQIVILQEAGKSMHISMHSKQSSGPPCTLLLSKSSIILTTDNFKSENTKAKPTTRQAGAICNSLKLPCSSPSILSCQHGAVRSTKCRVSVVEQHATGKQCYSTCHSAPWQHHGAQFSRNVFAGCVVESHASGKQRCKTCGHQNGRRYWRSQQHKQ